MMQDAVMQRLDEKHSQEQVILLELLDHQDAEFDLVAKAMTQLDRNSHLQALRNNMHNDSGLVLPNIKFGTVMATKRLT